MFVMRQWSLRSRSLKRLLSISIGRRSTRAEEESMGEDNGFKSMEDSPQKPTWRCFSFEEIHKATNGFHQGFIFQCSCSCFQLKFQFFMVKLVTW